MPANKLVTLGPVALTTTSTTNIFSPPTTTGGTNVPEQTTNTYYIIRHIRVINKTASSVKCALWKDATGGNTAGKEIVFPGTGAAAQGMVVPANSFIEWYGLLRLDAGDTNRFIVGGADTATALTIQAEAEMGIS